MPINQDQFLGSNANLCVTYPINANVAIVISNFDQKYVVVKAMRRSSGISKILLMKKLKSKVYISYRIRLQFNLFINKIFDIPLDLLIAFTTTYFLLKITKIIAILAFIG